MRYHATRGVPVAVVRPGAIYGPLETRLLKLFRAIARGRYAIVGDGRSFYHPVFIDDLVVGFLLALERPEAVGEAFLICGPRYVSQRELAALIAKHTNGRVLPFRIPARPLQWAGDVVEAVCVPFGIDPPLHRRRVDFWTKSRAFTIEKARRLLGYEPEGGPGRGHRAHRGVVSRTRVALMAPSESAGKRLSPARLALAAVCLALVAASLAVDLPRAAEGEFWGDGATYYAMAWSLARDRDVRYEAADLERIGAEYPSGPSGLFLKRASGGRHDRSKRRLPVAAAGTAGRRPALLREGARVPDAGGSARRRPRHARAHARERPAPRAGARARRRDPEAARARPVAGARRRRLAAALHRDAALSRLAHAGDPRPGPRHGGAVGVGDGASPALGRALRRCRLLEAAEPADGGPARIRAALAAARRVRSGRTSAAGSERRCDGGSCCARPRPLSTA